MTDQEKTKAQLLEELAEVRQRAAALEAARAEGERDRDELRHRIDQYRSFLSSLPGIVYRGGMDFIPLIFHGAVETITGYREEELIAGTPRWDECIHPEDLKRLGESLERIGSVPGYATEREYRVVRKDGQIRWVHEVIHNVCDESGKPAFVEGVLYDISERKQSEEQLRISEQSYQEIFDAVNDIVVVHDPQTGDVLAANSKAREALGFSAEETLGPTLADLCSESPYTAENAVAKIRKAAEEGPEIFEWLCRRQDGTTFWVEANLKPAVIGGKRRLLAVGRDITRRKETQEALRKARDELEQRVEGRTVELREANAALRREVAEHRHAKEARQASESRYRQLHQSLRDAYAVVDMQGRITEFNATFSGMLGYPTEEIQRLTYRDITPEQWHEHEARILRDQVLTRGYSDVYEKAYRRKDGTVLPVELRTFLMRDEAGDPVGMWAIIRDITQRKRAEQALRESEEKYRALAEKVNDIPYTVDMSGRFTYVGPQVARYGADPQDMLGRSLSEFVDPEDRRRVADDFRRSVTTGEEFPTIFRVCTPDGRIFWLEDEGRMQRDTSGRVVGMTGILRDVTERRRAEQLVLEEQQRLRQLLSMHERDRQLVAFEIHDGFAQPLAAALMQFEGGLQQVKSRHPDLVPEACEDAIELLRRSIDGARRLMGGLRPAVLDEFGPVAAVESLVDEQRRRTGATIEVADEVDFDRLPAPLELAIFRIVQEALANAIRHSRSERIRITLVQQEEGLRIEVQDWGVGFDPDRVEPNRFGLEGIRVRARLLGGSATIGSSPGRGAHITVELPLVERTTGAPDESER